MNTGSQIVYDWLYCHYVQTGCSDIDEIDPEKYAEQECDKWIEGAPGYEMDDDEEIYPPWINMILHPAITIDWAEIKTLICKNYKEYIERCERAK